MNHGFMKKATDVFQHNDEWCDVGSTQRLASAETTVLSIEWTAFTGRMMRRASRHSYRHASIPFVTTFNSVPLPKVEFDTQRKVEDAGKTEKGTAESHWYHGKEEEEHRSESDEVRDDYDFEHNRHVIGATTLWKREVAEDNGERTLDTALILCDDGVALESVEYVTEFIDHKLYLEKRVKPFEKKLKQLAETRDEVAAVRSTQFGELLHEDIYTVLALFLSPQCPTEEVLEELFEIEEPNEYSAQWLFNAMYVDTALKTHGFYVNSLKFIIVGASNWLSYIRRVRVEFPSTIARLTAVSFRIPDDIGDAFFDVHYDDKCFPIHGCLRLDAVYGRLDVLPALKRRMPPRIYKKQVSIRCQNVLAIEIAIVIFANSNAALDLEYMRLLIPSDITDLRNLNLLGLTQAMYSETSKDVLEKSLEIVTKLNETEEFLQVKKGTRPMYFPNVEVRHTFPPTAARIREW